MKQIDLDILRKLINIICYYEVLELYGILSEDLIKTYLSKHNILNNRNIKLIDSYSYNKYSNYTNNDIILLYKKLYRSSKVKNLLS
jgi:hypothetical protein